MKTILEEDEIEIAIQEYIKNQPWAKDANLVAVDIELEYLRSTREIVATVEMGPPIVEEDVEDVDMDFEALDILHEGEAGFKAGDSGERIKVERVKDLLMDWDNSVEDLKEKHAEEE